MKSIKIISTVMVVFVLFLVTAIAQQSGQQAQTQQPSKTMDQSSKMMQNWVGIDLYGTNNQNLGSVNDVKMQKDQVYLFIEGSDKQIHPVPISVINRLMANITANDLKQSPAYSMNQIEQDSTMTWVSKTDDYFKKFETQRPVSQRMEGQPSAPPSAPQPSGRPGY